jgi:exodeoxyribonuclease III
MRLITWNVNSLRARLPRVLELLEAHTPDVVCLQETKVGADAFPHDALAAAGYQAVERSEGRWNGVAILAPRSSEVADVVASLPGEPDPGEARWIEATIGGVRVVSVYVPNGRAPDDPMFLRKLSFLAAVRDRVRELVAAGPTVVAGDVNVAPEDRDVWDPAMFVGLTHVTPEERARLAAVRDAGVRDAFREVCADAPGYTWWDYRAGAFRRGMGMRIDLTLVSRDVAVHRCEVDTSYRRTNAAGDKPSDHAPLVADLAVETVQPRS